MLEWKDIYGYEGLYKISNIGTVLSLAKNDGNGNRDRLLVQEVISNNTTSYRRVTLSKNGKVKRFQVHRLVAKAFIPNPDKKPFINHINNEGMDNVVENLEWCTHSENMIHAQKQGRLFNAQSKGGKTRGIVEDRVNKKYDESLNKIYGFWKVLYVLPYEQTIGKHRKAVCLCTHCNNYAKLMHIEPVLTGKTKLCSGCSLRKNKKEFKNEKIQKQIIQLTKENEYIATHKSVHDAQLSIGVNVGDANIYRVCNGERKSAHGYVWKYKI